MNTKAIVVIILWFIAAVIFLTVKYRNNKRIALPGKRKVHKRRSKQLSNDGSMHYSLSDN